MKVYTQEVRVSTGKDMELVNITDRVKEVAKKSGISDGTCFVYSLHTTTAIIVNENESGLMKDIVTKISHDFPKHAGWEHDRHDNNAHAHLAATYLGSSKAVPVAEGRLRLGTWQSIFFVELDGPRSRSFVVQVLGNENKED